MEVGTLRAYMRARGVTQADLARQVGVSRQAVSLWLAQSGEVSLRARHLVAIARALGTPIERLIEPLPGLGPEESRLHAELLWDHLYPDLVDLAIAVRRGEPRAIGRLLEVYGLYATARMAGESVWQDFDRYARFIHPTRRAQLARLQQWHESNRRAA